MNLLIKAIDIINSISDKIRKFIDEVILGIDENNNPKLKPVKIKVNENGRRR